MSPIIRVWTRKRIAWLCLGLLAIFLTAVLSTYPATAELLYGRWVYPIIRVIFHFTLGQLPIPGVTILLVLGLVLFVYTCIRPLRRRTWTAWSLFAGVLSTAAAVVFLFQLLWGFNYARHDIGTRMQLDTNVMTREDLEQEFLRATNMLTAEASAVGNTDALKTWTSRDYELAVRDQLGQIMKEIGMPEVSQPRVRLVRPKGILMRWNTAGIFLPYSGEGHVDAGMLPVQVPFTLSHEMTHGYGLTDEGDCNFIAYLACIQSASPLVNFSGHLTYWRYVAGEYRYAFPEKFEEQYHQLPPLVLETLVAIHKNDALYPDLLPRFRNLVYDSYLKSQGVHEGLRSYHRVVQLVWAHNRKSEH